MKQVFLKADVWVVFMSIHNTGSNDTLRSIGTNHECAGSIPNLLLVITQAICEVKAARPG